MRSQTQGPFGCPRSQMPPQMSCVCECNCIRDRRKSRSEEKVREPRHLYLTVSGGHTLKTLTSHTDHTAPTLAPRWSRPLPLFSYWSLTRGEAQWLAVCDGGGVSLKKGSRSPLLRRNHGVESALCSRCTTQTSTHGHTHTHTLRALTCGSFPVLFVFKVTAWCLFSFKASV